jgi:hypothetical protein
LSCLHNRMCAGMSLEWSGRDQPYHSKYRGAVDQHFEYNDYNQER